MSSSTSAKSSNPAHILLVDDNKMGLTARKVVLEEIGYRITTFNNGKDALENFGKSAFDLVVTDYRMPNMDGIELIGHLRERRPDVPVILISGFADTLGLSEKTTGADIVIQKSNHEVTNLIRAVQRLLARKAKKPASSISGKARGKAV